MVQPPTWQKVIFCMQHLHCGAIAIPQAHIYDFWTFFLLEIESGCGKKFLPLEHQQKLMSVEEICDFYV
jgi:hypothetical protein